MSLPAQPASSNIPAPSGAPVHVWSNATSSQPSPSKPTALSELASGVPSKVAASSGKPASEQAPSAKPSSAEPSSGSQPSGHGPSFVKPSSSGGHSAQPASPEQPSSTGHTSSHPASTGNPQPPRVGPFELLGCFGSSRGFPTFQKVASSNAMSLDLCASSCPSPFFGVYETDCYCGQRIEPSDGKVSNAQCDKPCPGNKNQVCGGGKARLARRGDVPAGLLLSVYERKNDRPTAALKVVTSTQVITITSCPPVVTDCPVGQTTTKTWIATVTPQPGPEEWHNKVVTCYGDYCVSGHDCDECQHTRVVFDGVRYQCEASPDSKPHRLVHCKDDACRYSKCRGDRCNQKVVCWDGQCTPAACYGDECDKKLVCSNGHCEHQACHGEDCHKMWVCDDGHCTAQPGCTGDCVAPPPVKPAPGASPSSGSPGSGPNGSGSPSSGSPGSGSPSSGSPGSGSKGSGSPSSGSPGSGPNGSGLPSSGPSGSASPGSASGKPENHGNSKKPADSGSPGNKAGTGHVEGPGKPGNGGSASHEPEPDKSGHNGAAGHNEHPAKPGNKADAGHDQGPGESGNKAGSGNKPSPAGPSPSGDKQRPAGVKSATHPKNTSPVVAGSTKRAVGFHILAAAVGLALMM
ncbi:WSC domain containing protein, partial [Metarhizium majus ARSEF 297]